MTDNNQKSNESRDNYDETSSPTLSPSIIKAKIKKGVKAIYDK